MQSTRAKRSLTSKPGDKPSLAGQGDRLAIEVLDVDLAGEVRFPPRGEVRVLRGAADWPRIRLRYTLDDASGRSAAAEETVSDPDYLRNPLRSYSSLGYEKRMLEEWFRKRFAARQD